MGNKKKVVYVIMEGKTETVSLFKLIQSLFKEQKDLIVSKITIDRDITASYRKESEPDQIISNQVKKQINIDKIKKSDIDRIIQITDLDGCFIEPRYVEKNRSSAKIVYSREKIMVQNPESQIGMMNKKARMLNVLSHLNSLLGKPYHIYYLSLNFEDVSLKSPKSKASKKVIKASRLKSKTSLDDLRCFFADNDDVFINMSYEQSWEKVEKGLNSLQRLSNIHLLFNK